MGLIYQALVIVVVACLAFAAGRYTHECPKPKDPEQVIKTHEVIRYVDRPTIERESKTIERIVEKPVYRGNCLDDDGLRSINNLTQDTAAGRADIGSWTAEPYTRSESSDNATVDSPNDSSVSTVSD